MRVHGSHHPQGPTSHDRQWRKDSSSHHHHPTTPQQFKVWIFCLHNSAVPLLTPDRRTHSQHNLHVKKLMFPIFCTHISEKNILRSCGVPDYCLIFHESEHHLCSYITHMGVLNFSDYFGSILYFCLLWMAKFFFVFLKTFANIHRLFLPFLASWSPSSSHNTVVLAGEDLSMLHQMTSCG